ncbi:MAG: undecaprenyl-diphosphate phosphatase [Aureliella sp.]
MESVQEIVNAIILGVIQGLTEFLPVSSSGHLELGKALQGGKLASEESMAMTVVLHAATALSTIVIFREQIGEILKGLFQFKWNEDFAFASKIVLSMIPAVAVGLLLEDQIESLFSGQIVLVGFMLLATGGLLFLAERAKETDKGVSYVSAIIIGIAQAIAILPGISRSGATISTSVLLGIDRSKATTFSFLMVIPLILGKMAKDLKDGGLAIGDNAQLIPLAVGFVAAFITGFFACKWMIQLVKKCQLWWFSIYCFVVGILAIGFGLLV